MAPERPTFEIGFVLAGAISAGCYAAGVMDLRGVPYSFSSTLSACSTTLTWGLFGYPTGFGDGSARQCSKSKLTRVVPGRSRRGPRTAETRPQSRKLDRPQCRLRQTQSADSSIVPAI